MKPDKIKRMLDACYLAKRIRELLPELPYGVAPAYIQYIDVIHHLLETNDCVKVSDISDWLNLPRPGVTRTVKDMEVKGYLKKTTSQEDARITYITVTDNYEEFKQAILEKYDAKVVPAQKVLKNGMTLLLMTARSV